MTNTLTTWSIWKRFMLPICLWVRQDGIPLRIPLYLEFGTPPMGRQIPVGILVVLTIFGCYGFRDRSWLIPMNSLTHLGADILRPFLHDWFLLPSWPNSFHRFSAELMIKVVAVGLMDQVKINGWQLPGSHLAIPRVPVVSWWAVNTRTRIPS